MVIATAKTQKARDADRKARGLVAGRLPADLASDMYAAESLVDLATPIAYAAVRKVGGGLRRRGIDDFGRQKAFDAIVLRAVIGGRLPWRRQFRRTAKYHGWIHKQEVNFSTYVWRRVQNDFRSWIKEVMYLYPERVHNEDLTPPPEKIRLTKWYDGFVHAWRHDRPTLLSEIQGADIPDRFKEMLLALIRNGYDFDRPRRTRPLFREYAASQGLSPQKAAQRLGTALRLMRRRLAETADSE